MKRLLIVSYLILISEMVIYSQEDFYDLLAEAAVELINVRVVYDPAYYSIDYPNGDLPENRGVCTDVVIRAYRKLGIDLQVEVHDDMVSNFELYPRNWGLNVCDKNIDHRRVPNLMKFFERKGESLTITDKAGDYISGDIVCWDLGGGITHIGIVINRKSCDGERNLIVHNIGNGQVSEDVLFGFKIIGHYRYGK